MDWDRRFDGVGDKRAELPLCTRSAEPDLPIGTRRAGRAIGQYSPVPDPLSDARVVPFDPAVVVEALKAAVVETWREMTSKQPGERIYGLVLYEGAEHGYICVTPFTEEGLARVVDNYRESGHRASEEELRWSVCDSPYHPMREVAAPPLVSSDEQYRLWNAWAVDDEPFFRYKLALRTLCMRVLRELDADGVFAPHRESLTLWIEDRDGMETAADMRAIIAELNPGSRSRPVPDA